MAPTTFPPGPDEGFLGRALLKRNRIDPTGFMKEMAETYGDIVHFRAGFQNIYFLNHPDFVRDVLSNHYGHFVKGRGIKRNRRFLGNGLITSEGEEHRAMRQRTAPAFHRHRLEGYARTMVDSTTGYVEGWEEGGVVEILHEMRRLMVTIIGRTMFSFETNDEVTELHRAVEMSMAHFKPYKVRMPEWLERLIFPYERRASEADAYLERQLCRFIDERRRKAHDNGDLLTMLVEAHGEEGEITAQMNKQLRDEALTIFFAAYETNSTALMWIFYLLTRYPEVEAKLLAELDAVLGDRRPAFSDFPNLVYTERVYSEALRLYPPVWRLMRYAIRDYEIGGYRIPAKSLVVLSQFVTQRDARFFPDPLHFDPERWTPQERASRLPGTFFPFGGGARRCIGEAFAMMEGVLVLATIAREWRLRLAEEIPIEIAAKQLLHPKQRLRMIVERRTAIETAPRYAVSASGSTCQ